MTGARRTAPAEKGVELTGACAAACPPRLREYARGMAYTSEDARTELLEATAEAAAAIGVALAAAGEAYELVSEDTADRLEAELFGPLQAAYGRAKRGHAEFAARCGREATAFAAPAAPAVPSSAGAAGYLEVAIEHAERADDILSELQDSLLPVEAGDAELRAALADVRTRLGAAPAAGDELLRTLGR